MLTSNTKVWLCGEYETGPPGILTIKLDTDRYGSLEVSSSKNMYNDPFNAYLNLKAVAPNAGDKLLHVVTGAFCGETLVTVIRPTAKYDKALCFTLATQIPSE